MLVYVDDIMLTGDDNYGIADVKKFLVEQFAIKKILFHYCTFWEWRLPSTKEKLFSQRGNM